MSTKEKYFWYLIVGLNISGILLPVVVAFVSNQPIMWNDVPQNMAMCFISIIVSGCADKGIELFDRIENNNLTGNTTYWKSLLLDGIGVLFFSVLLFLFTILSVVHGKLCLAYFLGLIGVLLSLKTCWNVKVKEDPIDPANALGGNNFD